ncbi:MAG: glycosyltransferase family 4 protein [Thermogutta sp.]
MKVLHLLPNLNWVGGVETYVLTLLPLLEERGVVSVVAYGSGNGQLASRSHHVPSLNRLGRWQKQELEHALNHIIDTHNPDLIHVHHINSVEAIQLSIARRPVVITTHGYQFICPASDLSYDRTGQICSLQCSLRCFAITWWKNCMSRNPRHAIPLYRRARWVMRNARRLAAILSPSEYTAERHIRAGFPREKVAVLPYFCPVPPLHTPRPEPTIGTLLFMGRLQKAKGFHVFIEALGHLSDVRGVLVGNLTPSTEQQVKELALRWRCANRLTCLPWADRSAVPGLLKQATVLIFPSLSPETLGIVGLEALAYGVPVVASDVGGVREWLRNGVTGYVVPPGDPGAIACRVRQLLASRAERLAMGQAGIELVRTKFDPARHVERLINVYHSCVREKLR